MVLYPSIGILPRPFNSFICTYCLCYSLLPALLCNDEGWEYPGVQQHGSSARAAAIPPLIQTGVQSDL